MNRKRKTDVKGICRSRITVFCAMILLGLMCSACGEGGLTIRTMQSAEEEDSGDGSLSTEPAEQRDPGVEDPGQDTAGSENAGAEPDASSSADIVTVYICGAVVREGVYTFPAGSRVERALQEAGGYAEDAARGRINLARLLVDGEQIYFPTEQEIADGSFTGDTGAEKGTVRTSADGRTGETGQPEDTGVNINTADKKTLTTLPGIGESRAADIIAYREKHGPFQKKEDLMKVSGIKEATYQKLRDLIMVQ